MLLKKYKEMNMCFFQSNFNWMIKIGVEFNLIIKVLDDKYGDWMFGVFIVVNDNIFGGILFVDCYFFLNNSCKYGNILKEEYILGD